MFPAHIVLQTTDKKKTRVIERQKQIMLSKSRGENHIGITKLNKENYEKIRWGIVGAARVNERLNACYCLNLIR